MQDIMLRKSRYDLSKSDVHSYLSRFRSIFLDPELILSILVELDHDCERRITENRLARILRRKDIDGNGGVLEEDEGKGEGRGKRRRKELVVYG